MECASLCFSIKANKIRPQEECDNNFKERHDLRTLAEQDIQLSIK